METHDYQRLAARTMRERPDYELTAAQTLIVGYTLGLVGEAGEVAEIVKKGFFHQHGVDTAKLKAELGDVLWYIAALCTHFGLDLGDVMQANVDKLVRRYPDGYSHDDSRNRDPSIS